MINKSEVEALKSHLAFTMHLVLLVEAELVVNVFNYLKKEVMFSLVSYSEHYICGDIDDGHKNGYLWEYMGSHAAVCVVNKQDPFYSEVILMKF